MEIVYNKRKESIFKMFKNDFDVFIKKFKSYIPEHNCIYFYLDLKDKKLNLREHKYLLDLNKGYYINYNNYKFTYAGKRNVVTLLCQTKDGEIYYEQGKKICVRDSQGGFQKLYSEECENYEKELETIIDNL